MSRVISMSQAIACDSEAVEEVSNLLKIGCRRGLVKKIDVLNSRTGYMLCNISTIWLIIFTKNAFDAPEISADLFVYTCDVTFGFRARAEAWSKAITSPSRRSHWKKYRPAEARIYHNCVEVAILIGMGSGHLKFRWDNTLGSLTPTIHTRSCLIP